MFQTWSLIVQGNAGEVDGMEIRDSRIADESGEAGQSQESLARKSGQRTRNFLESSCKQTQLSLTHHNSAHFSNA